MAETLLGVLLPIITTLIQDEFGLLRGFKEDLRKLETTLNRINVIREAADEHQFSNKELKNWLEYLNEVAHEADDVVDECKFATTKAQQSRESGISNKQVRKFLPSRHSFKKYFSRRKIGHKLKAAIKCLDECEAKRPNIPEGHPNRGSENRRQRRETDASVAESEVLGREEDREKIVELLLTCVNSQGNLSTIPIVGMGGIGKTTLAQLVYNDTRVKDRFDLTIWVCVSEEFDHNRLIRAIIESVTKNSCDLVNANPLQEVLRKELNGKKFLLVLDDVWNENEYDWERLKNLLTCGRNGSSVLVTTRSPIVAKIMGTASKGYNLAVLSRDDCLSLFKNHAFGDGRREDPKLVEIGRDIVNKCGGVPLAAKTLGCLMYSKSEEDEWLSIKESELWQSLPEDKDHILPALRLSYIHLPYRLRGCFVFCSVFPKDYEMEKEELVHMWMASGLVQDIRDGHETFNELLGRSFFQDIKKDRFGVIRACKIHDLMHDLAKSVSRDECYSIDSKEAAKKVCERTKHLHFYGGHSTPTMSLDVAKRLRSLILKLFILSKEEADQLLRDILKFEFLHILCLPRLNVIRKIPSFIGSLKHLRYLNSSSTGIESLPESIGNLLNLQILKLGNCCYLKKLPESIGKLLNLQILELRGCRQLENVEFANFGVNSILCITLELIFQFYVSLSVEFDGLNYNPLCNRYHDHPLHITTVWHLFGGCGEALVRRYEKENLMSPFHLHPNLVDNGIHILIL